MRIVVESKPFKTFLKLASYISNEIRLYVDRSNISFCMTDPTNVQLIYAKLKCDADDRGVIGIEPSTILKLVRMARDNIEITVKDGEAVFSTGNARLTTKLIDPTLIKRQPKMPELKYEAHYYAILENLLRALGIVKNIARDINYSPKVTFKIEDGKAKLIAEGDTDALEVVLAEGLEKVETATTVNSELVFPVVKILNQQFQLLHINQSTDFPLQMLADNDDFRVEVYTAPILE